MIAYACHIKNIWQIKHSITHFISCADSNLFVLQIAVETIPISHNWRSACFVTLRQIENHTFKITPVAIIVLCAIVEEVHTTLQRTDIYLSSEVVLRQLAALSSRPVVINPTFIFSQFRLAVDALRYIKNISRQRAISAISVYGAEIEVMHTSCQIAYVVSYGNV